MSDSSPPLAGVTIVDLGRVLAAPFCTSVLAHMGARVIKVEKPGTGDDSRAYGPFKGGGSIYFASVNCDKESIALDLKRAEDRTIFESMLDRADVLVENFSPGVMDRLGYGWDALHARWPRLIVGALSGFGQSGPMSGKPAYDIIVQALGGLMSLTGHPGGPPTRVGASVGDLVAGLYLALGISNALYRRTRTGEGCMIDVAMLDCQIAFLEAAIASCSATGAVPGPVGTRHPSIAPFQAFETADSPIVIGAGNDALFRTLCAAIGREDLAADPRFASNSSRFAHVDDLQREIERTLRTGPAAHWLAALDAAAVPSAPIQNVAQAMSMPQAEARSMILPVDCSSIGTFKVPGNPVKISDVPERGMRKPPPALDADRARILAELVTSPRMHPTH